MRYIHILAPYITSLFLCVGLSSCMPRPVVITDGDHHSRMEHNNHNGRRSIKEVNERGIR